MPEKYMTAPCKEEPALVSQTEPQMAVQGLMFHISNSPLHISVQGMQGGGWIPDTCNLCFCLCSCRLG
ncbi:hypothetical protein XELAEV_18018629mg [Xenopus laevis]|uniref:Uncharacterized protein n=1 Tax=Xenopus laevis TaxID=8355 RepID=A0A974DDH3_XENLA|nr:hypothetical protein XELAEV_18018629mg [Xenopus laevis]